MDNPMIGHNNPPDPIDTVTAAHSDLRDECANWLDGTVVENEGQMKAVDALIKAMKSARKELDAARDAATKPLHESWKNEISRWKPTEADYDRHVIGLVASVDAFKHKLAAEKAAAAKAAEDAAWESTCAARELVRQAAATDLEAQRAADQAMADVEAAQALAKAASKDTVKGLRTVRMHEVTDHKALLNWIAKNDRAAVTAFIDQYAKDHHKQRPMDGVRTWEEKQAW